MHITVEETQQMIENKLDMVGKEFGDRARLVVKEIVILLNNLQNQKPTRYIPVCKWNEYHSYPTVSAIRNYITRSEQNGFKDVFFRKGKSVYIDENKFFEWLRSGKTTKE